MIARVVGHIQRHRPIYRRGVDPRRHCKDAEVLAEPERIVALPVNTATRSVEVGEAGRLSGLSLTGEGWENLTVTLNSPVTARGGETLAVPFRGLPRDASKPLVFSERRGDGGGGPQCCRYPAQDHSFRPDRGRCG